MVFSFSLFIIAFHCWGDSLCGGLEKEDSCPWIFKGIRARPIWMPKLGPHFLCPAGCSIFVKSGALAAGTFCFHCMKSLTLTVHGSYPRGCVVLQAHIFWVSEKQPLHKLLSLGQHELVPTSVKKTQKLAAAKLGWLSNRFCGFCWHKVHLAFCVFHICLCSTKMPWQWWGSLAFRAFSSHKMKSYRYDSPQKSKNSCHQNAGFGWSRWNAQ